jgi:hypothetical protein
MARNLHEVVAAVQAERRAKIAAAYKQKLIAKKKKRQLEEAKRVMELDRNLIVIAVLMHFRLSPPWPRCLPSSLWAITNPEF